AAQIGTGFLRSPEAKIAPAWADALVRTAPEDTLVSRVFSGRPGRSIVTAYARAATAPEAPAPAPYPIQRGLTAGCAASGPRRITSTGFRLGPVNRPPSLPPNRPASSLNDRGREPRAWAGVLRSRRE